jgi:hypothetical protein
MMMMTMVMMMMIMMMTIMTSFNTLELSEPMNELK